MTVTLLAVSIPRDIAKKAKELAKIEERSFSSLVTIALKKYLEEVGE